MARLGRTDRNNKLHLFLPFGVVDRGIHASGVESNVVEVVMEKMETESWPPQTKGFPSPPDDARPRSGTRP